MLFNAKLIGYTTPDEPTPLGRTPGVFTECVAGSRCFVDKPKRSQVTAGADILAGVTALMLLPFPASPEPAVGGNVTYRLDRHSANQLMQIASVTPMMHGGQSHFELLLRPVR